MDSKRFCIFILKNTTSETICYLHSVALRIFWLIEIRLIPFNELIMKVEKTNQKEFLTNEIKHVVSNAVIRRFN